MYYDAGMFDCFPLMCALISLYIDINPRTRNYPLECKLLLEMESGSVFLEEADYGDPFAKSQMIVTDPAGMTKETIRTYFPETWIWELVTVG